MGPTFPHLFFSRPTPFSVCDFRVKKKTYRPQQTEDQVNEDKIKFYKTKKKTVYKDLTYQLYVFISHVPRPFTLI